MKEELDFLMYEMKKRDSNDYAKILLDRIFQIVLLSNKIDAVAYIMEVNDKDSFWILSHHFPFFSYKYQDCDFIKKIKEKIKQFESKVEDYYYKRFIENLQESIDSLEEDVKIKCIDFMT